MSLACFTYAGLCSGITTWWPFHVSGGGIFVLFGLGGGIFFIFMALCWHVTPKGFRDQISVDKAEGGLALAVMANAVPWILREPVGALIGTEAFLLMGLLSSGIACLCLVVLTGYMNLRCFLAIIVLGQYWRLGASEVFGLSFPPKIMSSIVYVVWQGLLGLVTGAWLLEVSYREANSDERLIWGEVWDPAKVLLRSSILAMIAALLFHWLKGV